MLKQIFSILFMLSTASLLHAQHKTYCDILRADLQKAIEKRIVSEMDYHYFKLLNVCEVSPFEMGMLDEAMQSKGVGVSWQKHQVYNITRWHDPKVDPLNYYGVYTYDQLPRENSFVHKYPTFQSFIKTLKLEEDDLLEPPIFIPKYNAIVMYFYEGNRVYSMDRLKLILQEKDAASRVDYAGGGLFVTILQDSCKVHHVDPNSHKMSKIIDQSGSVYTFPVDNNKTYITVNDYTKDVPKTSMYNEKGDLLYDDFQFIEFNPLSKTFSLRKDQKYTLLDYEHNTIIKDMAYIVEVWKDDIPYYVCDDLDNQRFLYTKDGECLLSAEEYDYIYIDRTPYAIVLQNNGYAIIDFITKEVLSPHQKELLRQLCPGYLTYQRDEFTYIIDPYHRVLAKLPKSTLTMLTMNGKALIRAVDKQGLVGVYDLFGNCIIDSKYNDIVFSPVDDCLILTSGQIQYKANRNGEILK